MKKFKRLILVTIATLMLAITTVSADIYTLYQIDVPAWGASSGPIMSYEIKSSTSDYGAMQLKTKGTGFTMWGNLHLNRKSKKALSSDIKLVLDRFGNKEYLAGEKSIGGKYHPSASSSNYEPNKGRITVTIWP